MLSKANLEIYQGDDYSALVTVTGGPPPPDLTGYVAQAQIRTGPADTSPQVVVEIATAMLLPNQITLSIPAAETICLSGQYFWDLQLTRPDGTLTTILSGNVAVTPEITRAPANGALRTAMRAR